MTLTLPLLKALRRLLRAGVRHAEIARRLDLSLWTISRVASERKLRRRKLALLTEEELPEDDRPPEYVVGKLRRCDACGGMVYQWPCLACRIRAAQASGVALPDDDDDESEMRPEICAPTGQPAPAQGAALGADATDEQEAPTGRAADTRSPHQRAPSGLADAHVTETPGLRPGLSQVGPLGRSLPA